MIIETSRELHAWAAEKAQPHTAGLDAAAAAHAVECIASVVWRNAIGQGLRLGDDWGWILDMYDDDAVRDIVAAACQAQADTAARRRRRGY